MSRSSHKEIATTFLGMAARGEARAAFEQYAAHDFRHHNPHFAGDARTLSTAMDENARQFPQKVLDVMHVIEEGDLVVVHGRVRMTPDGNPIALVHLFRFEGDRIAELWDIGQPLPENSPNQYGMF